MKTATQIAAELGYTRAYIWQIARELQLKPEYFGEKGAEKNGTLALFSESDVEKLTARLGHKPEEPK